MIKFIGRQRELAELNEVLAQREPSLSWVYGLRRAGKTALVLKWAKRTGRPIIYWVANRDTSPR